MKKISIVFSLYVAINSFGQGAISAKETYVENWKDVAVSEMNTSGIPASITLAQGILESGSGNSVLAREGNNHFGIKCHGWTGRTIYVDDDRKNECFRAYDDAAESFKDHSDFLNRYDRYAFLFTYDKTDYKSWAKGLKKAGYATNPKYPDLLIALIEDLGLDKYDIEVEVAAKPSLIADAPIETDQHEIYVHKNRVKYVIAKKGDTFYQLSKEFGLNLKQLYRYNDFKSSKDVLEAGDRVYIQPKRRASIFKNDIVVAEKEMTIYEVAQENAVKAKVIKKLNGFSQDDQVIAMGEKVTLR